MQQAIIRLHISELSWGHMRSNFEAALKKRVGSGKSMSLGELSEETGCHLKTVEGWFYCGTEPGTTNMDKLDAIFGADFHNEVRGRIEFVEHKAIATMAINYADGKHIRKTLLGIAEYFDPEIKDNTESLAERRTT